MKKSSKKLAVILATLILLSCGAAVYAAGTSAVVSPALNIISRDVSLIKTGLTGNEITFTAEDFDEALGVSKISSVVILTVPLADGGKADARLA